MRLTAAIALAIALSARAQTPTPPSTPAISEALATVADLRRRVGNEATEAGQRKAADAMLAARAELIKSNPNDARVPVWLADQAEDCFTVALPAGGDVDRALFGLAGPDARRRVRRVAVDMAAAADRAEVAAKQVLERTGADAPSAALAEQLSTVERPRRIPLLRAIADVLQVEMAEFDAGKRRALAESSIARIDTLLPELDDRTASVVARYAGLTAARIGNERDANRFLALAKQKAGDDEAMATLADLSALRAAGLLRGPGSAADAAGVIRGAGSPARQLAIAELEARLRRQAEGEAGTQPTSGLLAWTSPFTELVRRAKPEQASLLRDLAIERLAAVLRDGTPMPEGEPMAMLAAANASLDGGRQPEALLEPLGGLADESKAPAALRAAALRTLARADMAGDRWASAADRSLQLATEHPVDGASAASMALAVRIARELDRAADGGDAGARARLERAIESAIASFPEHADHAMWQLERQALATEARADARATRLTDAPPVLPLPDSADAQALRARLASAKAWLLLEAQDAPGALATLDGAPPPAGGTSLDRRVATRAGALAELDRDLAADAEIQRATTQNAIALREALLARLRRALPSARLPIEPLGAPDAGTAALRRMVAALAAGLQVDADGWTLAGDALRLHGDHAGAIAAYDRALAQAPDALEPLQGRAESLRVLGGDERLAQAMTVHRRLLAGREFGGEASQRDHAWWLSQLRQLQILEAAGRYDAKAAMRLNRLRALDESLGGGAFKAAFERLPARPSPG